MIVLPLSMSVKNILLSVGAVLGGFVFVLAASIGTDTAIQRFVPGFMTRLGPVLILPLVYRTAYGAIGSYLAGVLAPSRPMLHAIILGSIGFLFSLAGVLTVWNLGSQWYPVLLAVFALPAAWVGGKMAERR